MSLRENAFYLPPRRKGAKKNRNANTIHIYFVLNIRYLTQLRSNYLDLLKTFYQNYKQDFHKSKSNVYTQKVE